MRPSSEYRRGLELVAEGYNDCEIGRMLDIPRGTIRDWRTGKVRSRPNRQTISDCPICLERDLDEAAYSYLLGMYLGDGCLSEGARQVFKLRISLDQRYHFIINECARAVTAVRGRDNVGFVQCVGCVELYSLWKHWPCLFPQHGPGRKHEREIVLSNWQQAITARYPKYLVRGLIHSDGCRDMNWVNGASYPRYHFINHSVDIIDIYTDVLDRLSIHWTKPRWKDISVTRRADVTFLDSFVGPKG